MNPFFVMTKGYSKKRGGVVLQLCEVLGELLMMLL